ncbi:response regulator transcription factor [Peteryoungia desertarenae]|uniref:Response regulator transcription factor n=1 Tax=Peteryoungia desertarenae TaxID=1813451 RepID=A0ABX6QIM4_9HYPH|nr:response regulator transcription factor [Peteryoungia desertarenae]QLF68375.1 response regulator transcription factor [Peteryoungia desertarenae]
MLAPAPRVLIAETHYLIAMEVERILVETLSCQTAIVPVHELERHIETSAYDVVILDASAQEAQNADRARMIKDKGIMPVFLSSYDDPAGHSGTTLAYPVVPKPFEPEALAETVRLATAAKTSRPQMPSL